MRGREGGGVGGREMLNKHFNNEERELVAKRQR